MSHDMATKSKQAKQVRHLHFMGIGGISMSGLARWYRADGEHVSGCDSGDSSTLEALRAEGITVHRGHSPDHLNGVDVLVGTMAVADSEAEWIAAERSDLSAIKRIELLAELFERREAIGISGTHGKSTTTGMAAAIFIGCEVDPSVQIGAHLPETKGNVRFGRGPHLVAEVDESDPGFANLKAKTAIITNLEDDHIAGDFDERRNYHASLADLEQATRQFAQAAERTVYCRDWPGLHELLGDLGGAMSYGEAETSDYQISQLELFEDSSQFTFTVPQGDSYEVQLIIPGKHNVLNATAALSAAALHGLNMNLAVASLSSFKGVGRRWQEWGKVQGALIIDDYAHHPTEVEATLTTAKHTGRRVRAVLQPHRWVRTARHWPALADAASLADEIIVVDIYSAGEAPIAGVSPQLIVERLEKAGANASYHSLASAQTYLSGSLAENDLVITLGAGDVWRVAAGLVGS